MQFTNQVIALISVTLPNGMADNSIRFRGIDNRKVSEGQIALQDGKSFINSFPTPLHSILKII